MSEEEKYEILEKIGSFLEFLCSLPKLTVPQAMARLVSFEKFDGNPMAT